MNYQFSTIEARKQYLSAQAKELTGDETDIETVRGYNEHCLASAIDSLINSHGSAAARHFINDTLNKLAAKVPV